MAYRLRPEESIARGLRRVAKKELRSARNELRKASPPRDEAIHEARKSIKKVRAVVELVEADDGRGLGGCSRRLRNVNRTLSRLRDADAMLGMLTKLRQQHPPVFDEHTFARLRRRLSSHKHAAMEAAEDDGAWKRVDRALRTLRQDARRWRPRHRRFGALAAGVEVTYRRGRKALARAQKRQQADDFHEWRKHVKALWYQLRLVEGCSSEIRKDARALHQAETWLGDDHNLVVLCRELSKGTSLCDLERLRRAANRIQCELRRKAIARTGRIYRAEPGVFLRRVKRAWRAWQRQTSSRDTKRRRHAAA